MFKPTTFAAKKEYNGEQFFLFGEENEVCVSKSYLPSKRFYISSTGKIIVEIRGKKESELALLKRNRKSNSFDFTYEFGIETVGGMIRQESRYVEFTIQTYLDALERFEDAFPAEIGEDEDVFENEMNLKNIDF